jgi:ABC-type branched-subunit amino acid transport system permease subunit
MFGLFIILLFFFSCYLAIICHFVLNRRRDGYLAFINTLFPEMLQVSVTLAFWH